MRVVPAPEKALRGPDETFRIIGDHSSVPFLIRALDDPYFRVRCLAPHAIARLAQSDAGARAALTDKIGLVRDRAAESLDRIKGT